MDDSKASNDWVDSCVSPFHVRFEIAEPVCPLLPFLSHVSPWAGNHTVRLGPTRAFDSPLTLRSAFLADQATTHSTTENPSMTVTGNDKTAPRTTTIRVAIRAPNDGAVDLVTDAERRLRRTTGVVRATIDELDGIEPGLSATRVRATATVETASVSDSALRDRLADRAGVDLLAEVDPP